MRQWFWSISYLCRSIMALYSRTTVTCTSAPIFIITIFWTMVFKVAGEAVCSYLYWIILTNLNRYLSCCIRPQRNWDCWGDFWSTLDVTSLILYSRMRCPVSCTWERRYWSLEVWKNLLSQLRRKYGASQPLKGARIAGCLHMCEITLWNTRHHLN